MKSRLPVSALTVTLGTAALFGFAAGQSGQAAAAQAPQRVPAAAGAVSAADCKPGGACGRSARGESAIERLALPDWISDLVDEPSARDAGTGAAGQSGQSGQSGAQNDARTLPAPAGQSGQGWQGTQPQSAPAGGMPAQSDPAQGITTRGKTYPVSDGEALALTQALAQPLGGIAQLGGLLGNGFPGQLDSMALGEPNLETNLPDAQQMDALTGNLNASRQLGGITAVPSDLERADTAPAQGAAANRPGAAPFASPATERRALPPVKTESLTSPKGDSPLGLDLLGGLTNDDLVGRLSSGDPLSGVSGLTLSAPKKK